MNLFKPPETTVTEDCEYTAIAPSPPTEEEIQAARDRAEKWERDELYRDAENAVSLGWGTIGWF